MKSIIKSLVDAIQIKFNNEIKQAQKNSIKNLLEINIIRCDEKVVKDLLQSLLEYHVGRLCQKTFIYEFHKFRRSMNIPIDANSSKAFDLYVSNINEDMINEWFSQYEYLQKIVTNAIINSCNYVEKVCCDFCNDIEYLCEKKLVERDSKLVNISFLNSDPHNGSKMALCFTFEPTKKLIYKPRSLEFDCIIEHIFKDILKFDESKKLIPVASTLSRSDYGWQCFIEYEPVSKEEVYKAFYNLGLSAAVFAALGTTDLHDENVIFRGTIPYFIDLETGLKPSYKRNNNELDEEIEDILVKSIVSTSIIPSKIPTFPHNILIGAINTPYQQETVEEIFTIINFGTDAIDIVKKKISILRPCYPITLSDMKPLDPLPYQEDFIKGYEKGYYSLMKNRDKIIEYLSKVKCQVRVIVRPTVQYALMLDACLFPENLVDINALNKILRYLKPTRLVQNKDEAKIILKQELEMLKQGDIPYFYMNTCETSICSNDFVSKKGIFDNSPVINACDSLEKLTEKRLKIDKRLIAEGFSQIRVHESKCNENIDMGYESSIFSELFCKLTDDDPSAIIDMIEEQAIITNGDNKQMGWLVGTYGDMIVSYDSKNLISLHDAGGITLLFEHLSQYKENVNNDKYKKLFTKSKNGLKSLYDKISNIMDQNIVSIISGTSSIDYIFNHGKENLDKTQKLILELNDETKQLGDVYNGIMGIALVLLTYPLKNSCVISNFEQVINKNNNKYSKEGIAHGMLGEYWTMFRLALAKKDINKCEKIYQTVQKLDFDYSGWCVGYAGALMILSEMATILKKDDDFHETAKKAMKLNDSSKIDLSICHGAAGVLQSLLFSYCTLKDKWYLDMANKYWQKILEIGKSKGFYTGERNKEYLLGYFLGWSGLADSVLLLQVCNNGYKPWFPLNLSSNNYQDKMFRGDNYA